MFNPSNAKWRFREPRRDQMARHRDTTMQSYGVPRKPILLLIALTIMLLVVAMPTSGVQGIGMDSGLVLTVTVDKAALKRGDSIRIAATVKNVSGRRVLFLTQLAAYATGNIKLSTGEGTQLRSYLRVMLTLANPSRQDVLEMDPGDEWTTSFKGDLRELKFRDIQSQGHPEIQGLFLDFGNSSIEIPSEGAYGLTVEIHHPDGGMHYVESLVGVTNLWRGVLRSNSVGLEIR